MPALTAVELGPDTCVLVRVSLHKDDVRVIGVQILDPAAFPGSDAFIATLEQLRRRMKMPRRARVVLWGLPDGARPRDPGVRPLLAPLTSAGFRVERVVSPCNALAALARIRTTPRPDGATGWLAVDRAGVAIVVVRPGELLYSHSFSWDSSVGASGSQARMLQRYSLVAFLAPELRRAIAAARDKGARVDTLITCGNLPDLRSLTMPLIEELDLEVETLDSLAGLTVNPQQRDRLMELAPAIRMACAGAATREARVRLSSSPAIKARTFQAAALLAAAGGLGWLWHSQRTHGNSKPAAETRENSSPAKPPAAGAPGTGGSSAASVQPQVKPSPAPAPPAAGTADAQKDATAAPTPTRGEQPPARGADQAQAPKSPAKKPEKTAVPLLNEPLPQFSTILAAKDRSFAMVGGRVVTVGDTIGQRVITAIEPHAVVLREPSGVQIRVAIGGRFLGVSRLY